MKSLRSLFKVPCMVCLAILRFALDLDFFCHLKQVTWRPCCMIKNGCSRSLVSQFKMENYQVYLKQQSNFQPNWHFSFLRQAHDKKAEANLDEGINMDMLFQTISHSKSLTSTTTESKLKDWRFLQRQWHNGAPATLPLSHTEAGRFDCNFRIKSRLV